MKAKFVPFLALLLALFVIPAFAKDIDSGVDVGGKLSAYNPHHLAGPDKGTDTCPICKYGNAPAVQVWVNTDRDTNVEAIAAALHQAVQSNPNLKAFITVIGKPRTEVEQIVSKANYPDVAITYLDPHAQAAGDYRINTSPQVANTVFVYKDRTVKTKFVNLVADKNGVGALQTAIKGLFNS